MFKINFQKAQSTAEYVIVLGLIVAAVVAMQTYIKRGLQGRIQEAVDYTDQGGQLDAATAVQFTGAQYEPYYLRSQFSRTRNAYDVENLETSGGSVKSVNEFSASSGYQNMVNADFDVGAAVAD
ncbi:MAG: hypothetical protein A3G38_02000 [Omnitrophica WOR_2 bacterium RIFCSPLOWO2_12_FULL_51_8]|nr:MAG: hypothetical protein A3G38_02000 [Omnitrophica WOR_2 bacterium RIFCSPLOWO2_12_FULL_51_8]